MGLLSRFFGNPESDLERAEALLAKGEVAPALKLASKVAGQAEGPMLERAAALARRARTSRMEAAIEKADRCEATHPQDAIDWLDLAIDDARALATDRGEKAEDDTDVQALVARGKALQAELKRLDSEALAESMMERVVEAPAPEEGEDASEIGYDVLIGTLRDDLHADYAERPAPFRNAVVAISEARAEDALALLDGLDASDAVVRFERGRARMLAGDHDGARVDFEAAWPVLGDDPLDHQGMTSMPLLWADASMACDRPDEVAERLATMGQPDVVGVGITEARAQALLAAERQDEARSLLASALPRFPKAQNLRFLLAVALAGGDDADPAGAIGVLDAAVAACCSGGSCAGQAMHVPSLELLATLLLNDEASEPQRILDTINMAIHTRGGVTVSLARLQEHYHRRVGEEAAAAAAAEVAERLREEGRTGGPALLAPTMGSGSGAVL